MVSQHTILLLQAQSSEDSGFFPKDLVFLKTIHSILRISHTSILESKCLSKKWGIYTLHIHYKYTNHVDLDNKGRFSNRFLGKWCCNRPTAGINLWLLHDDNIIVKYSSIFSSQRIADHFLIADIMHHGMPIYWVRKETTIHVFAQKSCSSICSNNNLSLYNLCIKISL